MPNTLRDEIRNKPRKGRFKIGLTLSEVARDWKHLLDQRLMPLGISNARWIVLWALDDIGEPASQKVIAEKIGVEGPTLVRMLDRLEQDGWVRRRVCETDRRVKYVELCDKADEFLNRMIGTAIAMQDELLEDIPEEELEVCHDVLLKIRSRLMGMAGKSI